MSSLVTVVVRTINRNQSLLSRALKSVELQTYGELETIVVNDGGTSLLNWIKSYSILDIQLIESQENQGRSAAANLGIKSAKGKYLVFLDDDDFLYPNHIDDLVKVVEGSPVAYCDALRRRELINQNDCQLMTKELAASEEHSLKRMLEGNFIPINCLIFEARVLKANQFDEDLTVLEDWDLLIRLSSEHSFKHLNKIRAEYSIRVNAKGASDNTTGNNLDVWQQTAKLLKERYRPLWEAQGLNTIPIK